MSDDTLIELIRREYALSWDGIHGIAHWTRVRETGLRLAESTGACPRLVALFALLHDSRRLNEGSDPGHGARAGEFVRTLQGSAFDLTAEDLASLVYACTYHTDGLTEANITVQTCWDADRLDLGRVGIQPQTRYLCTPTAQDPVVIQWAYSRSQQGKHWQIHH